MKRREEVFLEKWNVKQSQGKTMFVLKFSALMIVVTEALANFFVYLILGSDYFRRDDIWIRIAFSSICLFILAFVSSLRQWHLNEKKYYELRIRNGRFG